MKLQFKRILTFITQTVFWVPLSLLINAFAVGPIWMLFDGNSDPGNVIFIFLPLGWAIAFGLNKFRQWLKGRQTDEYYDVAYDEVKYTYGGSSYDTIYINEEHNYGVRTESSNTFWGWVGIILSFVAFPLQLVAWFASFLSLFFPFIYVTARQLPEDKSFAWYNIILHTLFDFVFIKPPYHPDHRPSAKGFLWIFAFISVPVVDFFAFALLGSGIESLLEMFGITSIPFLRMDWLQIVLFFGAAFILLSILALIIKYTALLVMSYSKRDAKKYMRSLGRWSVLFSVIFLILILQ